MRSHQLMRTDVQRLSIIFITILGLTIVFNKPAHAAYLHDPPDPPDPQPVADDFRVSVQQLQSQLNSDVAKNDDGDVVIV
ncbi:MAG: hypothetical protein AAF639_15735 [Chloroflexota bacterium]